MRQDVELTDFTAGELTPKLKGRTDYKKYFSGCETLLNMVVMPQGGATKRPRTIYVASCKDQAGLNRPVRFVFSTIQAYMLNFSAGNVRVQMNDGVVLNGGAPVDIAVPYTTADLPKLKFCQSADTLYIFHNGYPQATLTRTSHVNWTYALMVNRDGPYLAINTTTTTVTPNGTSGDVTLAFSSTAGINNGVGFSAADLGRAVRIKMYSLWAWCLIKTVTDAQTVVATVQAATGFGAAGAIDGATWQASTAYVTGSVVKNATYGGYYIAVAGGISSTVAPAGNGTQILDGTITWRLVGGYDSTPWVGNTEYDTGVVVTNGSTSYQCIQAGKSGGSGGPTGTGSAPITDGSATWLFLAPLTFPTSSTQWRLGAWCPGQGYPADGSFWQARLHQVAPPTQPNHEDGSVSGDFTNYAPSEADGTVTDANALSWTLDDDQVNAIHAISPAGSAQTQQLALFTDAGEHILQAAQTAQALTPTSVQAYRETSYGSSAVEPLRIGKSVLFADRSGLKVREFSFYWQSNGYNAPDLLQPSEHILRAPSGSLPALSGLKWWAYQPAPYQVIWGGTNGGKLVSFTYDRDQAIWAPAQHVLGGNYYGGPPLVEWGDVIPSSDGTYDELWLTVLRTINGSAVRFTEVMSAFFSGGDPDNGFFADAAGVTTLNFPAATLSITGLSDTSPSDQLPQTLPPSFTGAGTFASTADAFTSNMVGTAILRVNAGKVLVTGYVDARHVTGEVLRPLTSQAPAASSSWSCTIRSTTVSGLDYLDGENVVAIGDGAYLGEVTVAAGAVTLPTAAALIYAGLPYTPVIVTMPFEPVRAAAASSQGKIKRVDTIWVRFFETLGASFGRRITDDLTEVRFDKVEPLQTRHGGSAMDNAPPLYSGTKKLAPQGGHDREGQVIISQEEPLPLTVLGIFAKADVQESMP